MNIRPVPVAPVGSGTRSRTRLSVLAPVAALLLVVAATWSGAESRKGPPGLSQLPAAPEPTPGAAATAQANPGTTLFPRLAFGLPVMIGEELLAARASGQVRRGLVAVGGLLRSDPLSLSCPAIRLTLSRTFCRRLAALFPDAGVGAAGAGGPGSSASAIAAQVLPGTPIPAILANESDLAPWLTGAIPVVVIGHFEDPRAPSCGTGREWCSDDFVVEQLGWIDGEWVDPVLVRDPAIGEAEVSSNGRRAQEIAARAAARGEQILGQAILGVRLLAVVDAQAAAVAGANRTGGIWYVRSIARQRPGDDAQVVWTVIDDQTGAVLGYSLPQP